MKKWIKITDGLFRLQSELGSRYLYQYLLVGDKDVILFDAGLSDTPEQVILPALREIGLSPNDITYLLISHADVDHFSGVQKIREYLPRIKVVAHQADVRWIESKKAILDEHYFYFEQEFMGPSYDPNTKDWFLNNIYECNVDLAVSGHETISLGNDRYIDVIHIPGHTPGHIALYDRKSKTAIIGDGLLGDGLLDRSMKRISPPPYYSLPDYLSSIEAIKSLTPELLLTGHFDVMGRSAGAAFIERTRMFVDVIETKLKEIFKSSSISLTLTEIFKEMSKEVGPFTEFAVELVGPIYSHLVEMEKNLVVRRVSLGTSTAWVYSR